MSGPRVVLEVRAGISSYRVHVGSGTLRDLGECVPLVYERAAMIHDDSLPPGIVEAAAEGFRDGRVEIVAVAVPAGETAKSFAVAESVARAIAAKGVHRGDLIAGLGGGATTDLAGFVAATYHRGVDYLAMPTSLLGMVDASIGGKTAVNIPEGKNLVGAFHQPVAVVADVDTLVTLSEDEFRSGMAEILKHGLIGDATLLEQARRDAAALAERDAAALTDLVARAAAVKIAVVEADATEQDVRAHLNYGHTLGHAVEALGHAGRGPLRRHGEAVAIGMMFAAHLARVLGLSDLVAEHADALVAAGLPHGGAQVSFEDALDAMRKDKKYDRGLRFILLEAIGRPTIVPGVDEAQIRAAFEAIG